MLLTRVLAAVAEPAKASKAELQLVEALRAYVSARRAYVAQDAINAYDAWLVTDTYIKGNRPQSLNSLLDYGTVPPDFGTLSVLGMAASATSIAAGVATSSIPVLGDVIGTVLGAAGNGFADFSNPQAAITFGVKTAAETAVAKSAEFAVERLAKAASDRILRELTVRIGETLAKHVAHHPASVVIYTDSIYVADNFQQARYTWPTTGWHTRDGNPVVNAKLWRELVGAADCLF